MKGCILILHHRLQPSNAYRAPIVCTTYLIGCWVAPGLACPEVSGRGVRIGCDGGAQRHPYVPSAFRSSAGPGARDALMQSLPQALILKSVGLKLFHLGGFLPSIWYGIITKC